MLQHNTEQTVAGAQTEFILSIKNRILLMGKTRWVWSCRFVIIVNTAHLKKKMKICSLFWASTCLIFKELNILLDKLWRVYEEAWMVCVALRITVVLNLSAYRLTSTSPTLQTHSTIKAAFKQSEELNAVFQKRWFHQLIVWWWPVCLIADRQYRYTTKLMHQN